MSDILPLSKSIDYLASLSEDQLKKILYIEMNSENTDVNLIKKTLSILNLKSSNSNSDCNVDEAWESFIHEYPASAPVYSYEPVHNFEPSEKARPIKKGLPFLRTAIVAAVLISLLIGSSYAAGYNIIKIVAEWTSEVFSFVHSGPQEEDIGLASSEDEVHSKTADLKTALTEYGIKEQLAPNYLPEGFEQTEFYVDEMGGGKIFTAIFLKGDESICIQIQKHELNGLGTDYQKDDVTPKIYEEGGISHYIMTNMGNYKAVWVNGHFECSISGLKDESELIKIINSIYKE